MILPEIVDKFKYCNYNVITMKTSIIKIGNSKGVRIPKLMLEEARLYDSVELKVENGTVTIRPIYEELSGRDLALLSEASLSEWNDPREDEAWKDL